VIHHSAHESRTRNARKEIRAFESTALENAASVAGLMLTTECLIAERDKKDSPSTHTPAGHGDF
jgi:hypothetical protein